MTCQRAPVPRINRRSGDLRKVVDLFGTHETITRQQIADTLRCNLTATKVPIQSWLKYGYIRLASKGDTVAGNRYRRGPKAPKNRYVERAHGVSDHGELLEVVLGEMEEDDLRREQIQRITGLSKAQTSALIDEWVAHGWFAIVCNGIYTIGPKWLTDKVRRVNG